MSALKLMGRGKRPRDSLIDINDRGSVMKDAYLIVDIGTGTTRVALMEENGRVVAMRKTDTWSSSEPGITGSCIFLPDEWWYNISQLIKQAVSEALNHKIIAITCCSLREGIVLLDEKGTPVAGYMNSDRRGGPFIDELDWNSIWQEAGLYISPIYSAVKMYGTRKAQPERYEKTKYITSISDYVGYMFTGKLVWERAQAMHSAVYDPVSGCWSERMCELFGLSRDMLPPIAEAGSRLGPVCEAITKELGLKDTPYYIVGTADTQAALEGVNAAKDEIVIVSGTTSPCVRVLNEYEKYPKSWTSPAARKDSFMLEINTFSSGINTQRFKKNMLSQYTYDQLNRDASERGLPFAGFPKVMAVFSSGAHFDEPAYIGGFVMPSPMVGNIRPEDFYHALTLNTAMTVVMCLERHKKIKPLRNDYVIGCGNGFASEVIAKTVAGLSGLRVILRENWNEATVCGMLALCVKAVSGKALEPKTTRVYDPENSASLQAYYQQWKDCRKKINNIEVDWQ